MVYKVIVVHLARELWTMTDIIKYFYLTGTLMEMCVFQTLNQMRRRAFSSSDV